MRYNIQRKTDTGYETIATTIKHGQVAAYIAWEQFAHLTVKEEGLDMGVGFYLWTRDRNEYRLVDDKSKETKLRRVPRSLFYQIYEMLSSGELGLVRASH